MAVAGFEARHHFIVTPWVSMDFFFRLVLITDGFQGMPRAA
jgi:hypothetical protein